MLSFPALVRPWTPPGQWSSVRPTSGSFQAAHPRCSVCTPTPWRLSLGSPVFLQPQAGKGGLRHAPCLSHSIMLSFHSPLPRETESLTAKILVLFVNIQTLPLGKGKYFHSFILSLKGKKEEMKWSVFVL